MVTIAYKLPILIEEVSIFFKMGIEETWGTKPEMHKECYLLFLGGVEVTMEKVGRRE